MFERIMFVVLSCVFIICFAGILPVALTSPREGALMAVLAVISGLAAMTAWDSIPKRPMAERNSDLGALLRTMPKRELNAPIPSPKRDVVVIALNRRATPMPESGIKQITIRRK